MPLPFSPNLNISVFIDLNVLNIGRAADRAILDMLLARPCCRINGHDDLFVADVRCIVIHARDCSSIVRPAASTIASSM